MRCRKEKDFVSFFDEKTGYYMRTGIIENGKDTGKDPFMTSFPELLDVGIMGNCIHGKTGLCIKSGVECYQDGLHSQNANMSVADFEDIARQCKGKTYQFALGGCGDPDQHENFEEILNICKTYGIVPNFTTSGLGMSPDIAKLCKRHCGAVAVSWYRSTYTLNAIKTLVEAGVKTNIHYVLTKDSIAEALCNLKEKKFPDGINAVVFLLHKPIGLGTAEKIVTLDNSEFQEFIRYINTQKLYYKIGFDSCTIPALINNLGDIDPDSLDTCEGARWSAYITPNMKMLPCSFDNQKQCWAVDLRKYSIKEAWDSDVFENFRKHFKSACPNCSKRSVCMGGCPITPEVVLCRNVVASEQ
jgi:radical SAM protein with 4Fe4S-binding SPASM domain